MEGQRLKLAHVGSIFDIRPISGIDHVIYALEREFEFDHDVKCVAVTYSYSPDIIAKLHSIAPNIRVFAGRCAKPEMVRGAYVTPASVHFKGIMMWSERKVAYYIGSSNLTNEAGGNYGIIVVKDDVFEFFDSRINSVNSYEFGDPFLVIFNEIVFRETRGICEFTGKRFDKLRLVDGRFEGVGDWLR